MAHGALRQEEFDMVAELRDDTGTYGEPKMYYYGNIKKEDYASHIKIESYVHQ